MASTFFCVSAIVFACACASQLRNDPNNPFVAYGNGTKFDISRVFSYP